MSGRKPQIREQLWAALMATLEQAGTRYCVLGTGAEESPAAHSDVDLVIDPQDAPGIASVIRSACDATGAVLVQALQHETTACYFVMMKYAAGSCGYLNPDCTTDYRRGGQLWLRAGELLNDRRRSTGGYWIPSPAMNFIYYLLKKVLKQEVRANSFDFLRRTYQISPAECDEQIDRFFNSEPAKHIRSTLLSNDAAGFRSMLPRLYRSLPVPEVDWGSAVVQQVREYRRVAHRLFHPTGFTVLVTEGDCQLRRALVQRLVKDLAPAFRHTHVIGLDLAPYDGPTYFGKAQSTLVVVALKANPRLWPFFYDLQIAYNHNLCLEDNVRHSVHRVLEAMAERLARRLHSNTHVFGTFGRGLNRAV